MIIGLGTDLCDIRRVEKVMAQFGERFIRRCFTEIERRKAESRIGGASTQARHFVAREARFATESESHEVESLIGEASTYAKRFAAKEACAKALGTGFRLGVFHKDMGVVNLAGGKPTLALTGGAASRLATITPAGCRAEISLTLTDEYPMAQAIVIITAVPS